MVSFSKKKSLAHQRVRVRGETPVRERLLYILVGLVWTGLAVWLGVTLGAMREGEVGSLDVEHLGAKVARLESQLEGAREKARTIDSSVLLESTAKESLADQLRQVRQENAELKEELALFETMAGSPADARFSVAVSRVKMEAIADGRYRYRGVVLHRAGGRQSKEFAGEYHLELKLRRDSRDAMITVPADLQREGGKKIVVRSVYRVEGEFQLQPGEQLFGGSLVVTQNGVVQAKGAVVQ